MTPAEETQVLAECLMSLVHSLVNQVGTKNASFAIRELIKVQESASRRVDAEQSKTDKVRAALGRVTHEVAE